MKDVKPGRYNNITIEQYHRECPGWSKSSLDKVHRSMAHYLVDKDTPKEPTPSMAFGSAFHCAILESKLYSESYFTLPQLDRRTIVGKNEYCRLLHENIGKIPLSLSDSNSIELMKSAILSHPVAGNLFENGEAENSFFWVDKSTQLLCKCRPDYLRKDGICVELKSTKDASFDSFQKDVANLRYYVQGAFFKDGVNHNQVECKEFLICAVETEAPYNVNVFRLDEESIDIGRNAYKADLEKIKRYFEVDEVERFAGYSPEVNDMYLPNWIK